MKYVLNFWDVRLYAHKIYRNCIFDIKTQRLLKFVQYWRLFKFCPIEKSKTVL